MKNQVIIDNKKIEYTIRVSKRTRRVSLSIYGDGSIVITAPKNINQNLVNKFITSKAPWVIKKLEYFKNNPRPVSAKGSQEDYTSHKTRALILAKERVKYFNNFYGFKFNRISIRNQKTRWGSCSRRGNLNFNYKIILLPAKLADYIIVHELCHLKELNHSLKFWSLVAAKIPDYLELRCQLNRGGISLI